MASSSRGKNIIESYADLSIDDDEGGGLILKEIPEAVTKIEYNRCLIGSFMTNRKINFLAMQDTLASIWRPVKGVFMEETNIPNTFLFKFFHDNDIQRVLDDGPWTFNQQVLLIKKLEKEEQLQTIKLTELYIWLQVYDLPIGFNSECIHKSIGNYVGRFLAYPKNFQGIFRNYLRIKVAIDIGRPLKSRMRIKKEGGEWMWLPFKYERLPTFCFFCGLIGHSERFCEKFFDNPDEQGGKKYDSSLRATTRKQAVNRENQWIRDADGGKLIPVSLVAGGEQKDAELSNEIRGEGSGKSVAKLQGNDKDILTEDVLMGENEGITVSNSKRARKEGLIQNLGLGHTGAGNGLNEEVNNSIEQNQKNGLLAGTAMQARHSS